VRQDAKEITMAGGSKPKPGSKRKSTFQDGTSSGGGVNTKAHAGPKRKSKTMPTGTRGRQTQRRTQP
jgi:hypothetical protein